MARSAIKLTRDQRDAIYQAVRTYLVGLSDVFILLERQDDVPAAEKLAREFADDFRLLEDIGWHEEGSSGQVELTMPHPELSALMKRSDEHAVWINEVFAESISGFAHLRELMRSRELRGSLGQNAQEAIERIEGTCKDALERLHPPLRQRLEGKRFLSAWGTSPATKRSGSSAPRSPASGSSPPSIALVTAA